MQNGLFVIPRTHFEDDPAPGSMTIAKTAKRGGTVQVPPFVANYAPLWNPSVRFAREPVKQSESLRSCGLNRHTRDAEH
jgi:hypothetical protein